MSVKEIRVDRKLLHKFTREVFIEAGMPPKDAETEADALMWANLRGVDSHGVLRIPWYVENIETGVMNPKPDIKIVNETPATLLVEADLAMGPVVTIYTMKLAMEKAKKAGICWAIIRNLTHQGALGQYAQMAAENDMAGIVFVCNPPNMAPYGARAAGAHNSPIAISVPAGRHQTLNLDMATSVVAAGKLWLADDKGIPIPEGWGLDDKGNPTTDPRQVSTLLPFGGYKGSGLAIMFECLSSIMVGNALLEPSLLGKEIGPSIESSKGDKIRDRMKYLPRHIQNSVVAAIDISKFTDVEAYKEHIDNTINAIKALPRADGVDEIFLPGEIEKRNLVERLEKGIPLPEGTIKNLQAVSEKFGVKMPLVKYRS